MLTQSFPVREAIEAFVPQEGRNPNDINILVRMTVFVEFPATADLRAFKVETRVVGPPAPPVVLWKITP